MKRRLLLTLTVLLPLIWFHNATAQEAPDAVIGDALVRVSVVQRGVPGPTFCMDRTEFIPAVEQITVWSDTTTTTDIVQESSCRPWPTRCENGAVFIPPSPLAGYKSQCLAYGKPLFRWWVAEEFGSEASIASRVIDCESNWNPGAVGPGVRTKHGVLHAIGLMQLLGKKGNVWDPHENIRIGKRVRMSEGWRAWSCYK